MKSGFVPTLTKLAAAVLVAVCATRAAAQPANPPSPMPVAPPAAGQTTQPPAKMVVPVAPVASTPVTSVTSSGSSCGSSSCTSAFACCPEPSDRFAVFGDFLLLKARGIDVHYAQIKDSCGPLAVPVGAVADTDTEYKPGFRVGASYLLDDCSAVRITGTWWDGVDTSSIAAVNGNAIGSLITAPNTQDCGSDSQRASSRYRIEFRLVDLDYRHNFCSGCDYAVDWIVGLRYAHLDENFGARFDILGTTTVDTAIHFDGIGPRIGIEGERALSHGFGMYGRAYAEFLGGHFGSNFIQQNRFAGVQALTHYDDDRLVPMLDLELGSGWTNKSGCMRIEVGYLLSAWFNTLTTSNLIDGVRAGNFAGNGDFLRNAMTFDGLTARVAFKF